MQTRDREIERINPLSKLDVKNEVDTTYKDLAKIAEEVVKKHAATLDAIILKVKKNIETLSNKELTQYILELGIETYFFGQKKDYATLKQSCAEAIYKESYAKSLLTTKGTVAGKQNQATLDTMDNTAIKLLYEAISNLMKTRLDEAHRVANLLSGILISKNAEAKIRAQETYQQNPEYRKDDN